MPPLITSGQLLHLGLQSTDIKKSSSRARLHVLQALFTPVVYVVFQGSQQGRIYLFTTVVHPSLQAHVISCKWFQFSFTIAYCRNWPVMAGDSVRFSSCAPHKDQDKTE